MSTDSLPERTPNTLRIVSWNVARGLAGKKFEMLEALEPDIAIIPEAANEARLLRDGVDTFTSAAWIGRYSTKGLLALSFGEWRLTMLEKEWDQRLEWILPLKVTGPIDFTLFGVWSLSNPADNRVRYPSELHRDPFAHILEAYEPLLSGDCVIAGDFNHHSRWDKGKPFEDFSAVVDRYVDAGLTSAWHVANDLPIGHPSEPPTHWHMFNPEKPYTIDHCFVPEAWTGRILNVWVGSYDEFASVAPRSDHAPIVVDIAI